MIYVIHTYSSLQMLCLYILGKSLRPIVQPLLNRQRFAVTYFIIIIGTWIYVQKCSLGCKLLLIYQKAQNYQYLIDAVANIPSSSSMVAVRRQFGSGKTLLGSEEPLIERQKVSLLSSIPSLCIETLNEARTTPPGNVTENGPEK